MTARASRSRGMPRRSATQPVRASRTPLLVGVALIAILVAAAVLAIALGGAASAPGIAEPARAATVIDGTVLPSFTDPAADAAVGQPIPMLRGTDLEGNAISIGPDDGPMAVVLVAHWCSVCRAEVPELVDYLASSGMPDGVRLVGISTSIAPARPNYPPSSWLEREGWTAPTMVDDASSSALAALGMTAFPGFVFVDAGGEVVQRSTGALPMADFDAAVRSIAP